jgi:hypothetical protein
MLLRHAVVATPALVVPLLATPLPRPAEAQALASPRGTVTQLVDSTTMTVEYYRPSVRGRAIFGRLIPWGEMWTPGANWATTIEVDGHVRIQGQALPRGTYSLWMIPSPELWTVVLSRAARRFHVLRPGAADEQLRFTVRPDTGPHVEMLTFSFPEVTRRGATLRMQWARTVVPIALELASSRVTPTAARPNASYVGTYMLRGVDSAGSDATSPPIRYEVVDRGTGLWVRTTRDAVEPGLDPEFDLEPMGGDEFHPRQYHNGALVGVEADEVIVFYFDGAHATGFSIRGIAERRVLARARRARP